MVYSVIWVNSSVLSKKKSIRSHCSKLDHLSAVLLSGFFTDNTKKKASCSFFLSFHRVFLYCTHCNKSLWMPIPRSGELYSPSLRVEYFGILFITTHALIFRNSLFKGFFKIYLPNWHLSPCLWCTGFRITRAGIPRPCWPISHQTLCAGSFPGKTSATVCPLPYHSPQLGIWCLFPFAKLGQPWLFHEFQFPSLFNALSSLKIFIPQVGF